MHCILFVRFTNTANELQCSLVRVFSIYTKTETYSVTKVRDSTMLYIFNTVELTEVLLSIAKTIALSLLS